MKLVVDMNLSPEWVSFLRKSDFEAIHWTALGSPSAPDSEIMRWARENGAVVFTHDLDFGILLAHTHGNGPSVIQVRAQDLSPRHLGGMVVSVLRTYGEVLQAGALVTVEEARSRVRILPIKR